VYFIVRVSYLIVRFSCMLRCHILHNFYFSGYVALNKSKTKLILSDINYYYYYYYYKNSRGNGVARCTWDS